MNQSDALVIVDVQNDFCPRGSLAVTKGNSIVPVINRISGAFPLVAASQDWHPEGHISFASQHEGREPFDTAEINGSRWTLWPDHCVHGTEGAELHPDLDLNPVKLILRKGDKQELDSYSVFFENDKRTRTGMDAFLKGMGVKRIYLCGLAQDVCVYFSAMDAVRLGYETCLIEDATRGIDTPQGSLEMAMEDMKAKGVKVVRSDNL